MEPDFEHIVDLHKVLLGQLASARPVPLDRASALIERALNASPQLRFLEEREDVRSILRFWAGYISSIGEPFPDIDIDTPTRRPDEILSRPPIVTPGHAANTVAMTDTLAFVLAGGRGVRLDPLTNNITKPALPFGGTHRVIDFSLSNCVNSGLRRILVLTQYKSQLLSRHIEQGWQRFSRRELGEFVEIVPPQQQIDEHWYQGTADAVYQNMSLVEHESPSHVFIISGDHVYKADYRAMADFHVRARADATIAVFPIPVQYATSFGVVEADADGRVRGFKEKPRHPRTVPGDSRTCYAYMGLSLFKKHVLCDRLCRDATDEESQHDFGKNVIPDMIKAHPVFAFAFGGPDWYWRDIGTIDAYYEANMDLVAVDAPINLYDQSWPIRTYNPDSPPARFLRAGSSPSNPFGYARESIVCPGALISGAVERSIVGRNARIGESVSVKDSILFEDVSIASHVRLRRVVVDRGVSIPSGIDIGYNAAEDRARGFTVTENGVTVVSIGDDPVVSNIKPIELDPSDDTGERVESRIGSLTGVN